MKQINPRQWALLAIALIGFSYIVGSSYLGLNSHHPWRQTDVYGHILGFTETRGISPYELFPGSQEGEPSRDGGTWNKRVYDIPIYQYLIAKISQMTGSDPLVATRYVNLLLWLLTVAAGYRLCTALGGRPSAGLLYVLFLSISPIVLYWHSVPFPTIMSLAFSLAGILLFHTFNRGWKGFLWALPFLLVATLIKSPVPFVFVVFYSVYVAVNRVPGRVEPIGRDTAVGYVPSVTLLITLLASALFAEQLRDVLAGGGRGYLSPDARQWYFGTLELRTSADFWHRIWVHLEWWGPSPFGAIYLLVVTTALAVKRDKQLLAVTVACIAAFFSGWLVFANVYYVHDYHQLPLAVIAFLSMAVSLSHIVAWIADRVPPLIQAKVPAHIQAQLPTMAYVFLFLLALYYVVEQSPPRSRLSLYSGMEYALRQEQVFLHVTSAQTRKWNPLPGGHVSTKFVRVLHDDFETNCGSYLSRYAAVISWGYSDCLVRNKQQANYFIEDDGVMFYLKRDP